MKKIALGIVALILLLAVESFAAGSCVFTSVETYGVPQKSQTKMITLTCTGDGSITAFSFVPATYGVKGWWLYSVTTDPGTSAPTDQYDITLVVNSEDVANGRLLNRSTSSTETIVVGDATKGFWMASETMAITFANNTANPSTIVLKLKFCEN